MERERLNRILGHLNPDATAAAAAATNSTSSLASLPAQHKDREVLPHQAYEARDIRIDGWGYKDTGFKLNEKTRTAKLTGNRYMFSNQVFPNFVNWVETNCGVSVDNPSPPMVEPSANAPIINHDFLKHIDGLYRRISFDVAERVFHGHGQTCQEIYSVRFGKFQRVPDVVIWPGNQIHVEKIVEAASIYNVSIIPFGGGTSVSGALECPHNETRMIVSLDMHEMNAIKWIDRSSMLVCAEAGIVGQDLVARLEEQGLCVGHEPDSIEFSTLGGWVATRASGMKKNVYGNIEDLLVSVTLVTPSGTLEKGCIVPRISAGPDLHHVVLGSEGTLGVITQAVLKIRPLPQCREFGSILFPSFSNGVQCLREVSFNRCAPASIRLVDNNQFQFALALKPEMHSWFHAFVDGAKKFYVTQIKGFDPMEMCVATLLFEGTKEQVEQQRRQVMSIAAKHGGMDAGPENGHRGYFLTYVIAYLRDFGMQYNFLAESFETSVPWDCVEDVCTAVKKRIVESCVANGITKAPFSSCRVTQLYDSGVCIYFYVGFEHTGIRDPVDKFTRVYGDARDEIVMRGGSVSHHHGIGKHRKQWMEQTVSATGVHLLHGIKKTLDPNNIFGAGNLLN